MCNNQGSELHNCKETRRRWRGRQTKNKKPKTNSVLWGHSTNIPPKCSDTSTAPNPALLTMSNINIWPFLVTPTSHQTPRAAQKFQISSEIPDQFKNSTSAQKFQTFLCAPPHCSGWLWHLSCPLMLLLVGATSFPPEFLLPLPPEQLPQGILTVPGVQPEMLCRCSEWPFKH